MKKKTNERLLRKSMIAGGAAFFKQSMTAYASDAFDLSYLTDDSVNNELFADATDMAKGLFASGYGLISVIATAVAVFCIIMIALKFIIGGKLKEEAKSGLFWALLGIFLFSSAISIVSLIANNPL